MDKVTEELNSGKKRKNNSEAPKSIYGENYTYVYVKRPDLIVHKPDFPDIIAGPYKDPLLPDWKIPAETEWEKADEVHKRVIEKYPSLKKVLPETIDQSKITDEYKLMDKSTYQIEYSNGDDIHLSKQIRSGKRIKLPPNRRPIPLTTQRADYIDWKKIIPWNTRPAVPFTPPETQLGYSFEEQKILNIKTGKSEYEAIISGMGYDIMQYSFHGEVKTLPHEYVKKN